MLDPNIDNNMRAKINEGIAIKTSTPRLNTWSRYDLLMAAINPSVIPMTNDIMVVIRAIPIVFLAPYIKRDKISLPI